MSETYLKLERINKNNEEPSLMDVYQRLNKLELENEILKSDKKELLKENERLRSDNKELHNKLNENNIDSSESENDEGGWTEEETQIVADAYAMSKDYKFE